MERDKNNSEKVKEEKDINNIMEKTFINGEEFYTEKIVL